MELFVIIVNDFQPLTIITKSPVLYVAVDIDPPLNLMFCVANECIAFVVHSVFLGKYFWKSVFANELFGEKGSSWWGFSRKYLAVLRNFSQSYYRDGFATQTTPSLPMMRCDDPKISDILYFWKSMFVSLKKILLLRYQWFIPFRSYIKYG